MSGVFESIAPAKKTIAEFLADFKTVDGAGSGLDADKLDGKHASAFMLNTVTVSNCNTLTVSGTYHILSGAAGSPNPALDGRLLHLARNNAEWSQIAIMGVDKFYMRDKDSINSPASDWRRLLTDVDHRGYARAEFFPQYGKRITNWDAANQTGFFMGNSAANAPESGWCYGRVEAHSGDWVTQTVHRFNADSSANTKTYRRERNNGVWVPWYRVYQSEHEIKKLAPPKWGYESRLPTPLFDRNHDYLWAHGLEGVPTDLLAFLRVKRARYGYAVGEIVPIVINCDGDGARNYGFSANATNIILTQGDYIHLTRKDGYRGNNRIHTFAATRSYFEIFVKASL